MGLYVALKCERSRDEIGSPCQPLGNTTMDPTAVAAWVAAAVPEAGWTAVDGQYFCPLHNPAIVGEMVQIGQEYVEIAPGVTVRLPAGGFFDSLEVEVRQEAA